MKMFSGNTWKMSNEVRKSKEVHFQLEVSSVTEMFLQHLDVLHAMSENML